MTIEEQYKNDKAYKFAYTLSRIFDTPIMTLEIFLVFLIKAKLSTGILLYIAIGDMVLPFVYLIHAYKTKKISDLDISRREERVTWYFVMASFWALTLISFCFYKVPGLIVAFQVWLVVFGILNAVITIFWKISGHAMLSTSLVLWLSFLYNKYFLILLLLFVPLLCWARVKTRKHTPSQLLVGAILMFSVTWLIWYFMVKI